MFKKILVSFMLIITIFSTVSFTTPNIFVPQYITVFEDKNSVEGKFLREVYNDLRKTPVATITYSGSTCSKIYDTKLVCAIKAVRLCVGYQDIDGGCNLRIALFNLAKLLVKEDK